MQSCILSLCCIHLLEQFIKAVVDIVFECGEVQLNLDVGLLHGIQAGSRVLEVVFRSAVVVVYSLSACNLKVMALVQKC
jgi:hypothetical protein